MEIFEVLQILRLMHDVDHGFYIILPQLVSCGHMYAERTTDCALDVLAYLVLDGRGPRQGAYSPVYFHYNPQSRLGEMARTDDACSSDRWLRSYQRGG
jgi:hypothetical protein